LVERDLAVIVDEKVEGKKLEETIRSQDIQNLKEISIFDVYRGEQIEAGKKSVALRLKFQSMERTLTEEEVTASMQSIINILEQKHQGKIRL
jgi:phenylalanyl-tRNA synthetase beta chain